jgi:tetratricopeptide (TPR) repeat protein
MVSLSIHRLLRAGIMSMTHRDLILSGVGDLNRSVRLAAVPPFTFAIDSCSAEEVDVLEKAKARGTIRRLASTAKGLSLSRLRIAYAFLASGILEEVGEGARAAAQPGVQTDANAFLLSPPHRSGEFELSRVLAAAAPKAAAPAPTVPQAAAPKAPAPIVAAPAPAPPAPAAPAPVAAPPEADVSMEVERLESQANVLLMVSDFAGAVQVYAKLVELQPEVVAHRLRLAEIMMRWPQTERQAERQFAEAVRLDPDNAELHYRFGLYYKAVKVRSRAVAEFRTVVRLDPRHKRARAELEASSPQDSVLVTLKKLLG